MIHVLAYVTAKPGQREAVLREFRAILPTVHAEKGCIEYAPVIDTGGLGNAPVKLGGDTFAVVEKWATEADLNAHAAAPHMTAYRAKVKELIAKQVLHVLAPLEV